MTAPTATRTEMTTQPALHEAELFLPARDPFSWERSLDFIARFPATRGEQVIEDGELIKSWRLSGRTVVTKVAGAGGGVRVQVAAQQPVDSVIREAVTDRVSFYLSLTDDLSPLTQGARDDAAFAALERELHGYHQVKFPSPVEHLTWAILSQRTPMSVARAAKQQLAALNPPVHAYGHELQPFPSLDELARRTEDDLLARVGNARKASYLFRTYRKLVEVDEEFLRQAPYDEVESFLLSLPGIGPWSTNFVLIRGLGRMERIPQDDELLRAAARVYGEQVSAAEVLARAESYGTAQGYWAHYLRAGS